MNQLRVHYFLHVEHEGLGSIEEWIKTHGHSMSSTKFYENVKFPDFSEFDWLIVMGGSMGVNDEEQYPWLATEKQFIKHAVDSGKIVTGICLGSQLVAASLGAKVYPNKYKEIGWLDIDLTPFAQSSSLFPGCGKSLRVFQWHGDTFDLPENAVHLASSEGCTNQAFLYKERVLALQFHLEPTLVLLNGMIENGRDELTSGKFVQPAEEILANTHLIEPNTKVLFSLLDRLAEQ
jgi:GMP synthase-like glutamine amidotransferase